MNIETYRLTVPSQKYNSHIYETISDYTVRVGFQIRSFVFKLLHPNLFLVLLRYFNISFDNNSVRKEAGVWLFPNFMKEPATSAFW